MDKLIYSNIVVTCLQCLFRPLSSLDCSPQTKSPESSEEDKASTASLLCLSPHITEILEQGLLRCGKVTLFSILSLLAGWYDAFSVEQKHKVCGCGGVSV